MALHDEVLGMAVTIGTQWYAGIAVLYHYTILHIVT